MEVRLAPESCVECDGRPLALLMTQTARHVGRGLQRALEPVGLDARQYVLMSSVAAAEGCSQQAIGTPLQIPPSRMVALVDALEERGLIRRVPNPTDRRAHGLQLTPAGHRLLARARPLVDEFEEGVAEPLDARERAQLAALLQRVAARQREHHRDAHHHHHQGQ